MTNKPTQEQIKKAKDALITLGMEAVAYCERHCFDPAYAHKAKENIKTIESALEAYKPVENDFKGALEQLDDSIEYAFSVDSGDDEITFFKVTLSEQHYNDILEALRIALEGSTDS